MKKILILTLTLCVMLLSFAACDEKVADTISITVKVVDNNGKTTDFDIKTDADNLGDALDSIDLVQGEEGQYGLFITTVNGITVNSDNEEWWCLTKGGESVMTGIDTTPIADGDVFEITFTVGY